MKIRGRIVGRTAPKIQLCPSCGQMRCWHHDGLYKCPVRPDITNSLVEFRNQNGPHWKSKLVALWESGKDDSLLREARNMIGPRRLYKITLPGRLR